MTNVREMRHEDFPAIKKLDREGTGEDRFQFIERFLSTGWVYAEGTSSEPTDDITGFYLPALGGGLIIAQNNSAGLELMKLRLNRGKTTAVVPATNTIAQDFLISEGFQEYRRSPRMVLGNEVNWQPAMMFNRPTGYSG